MARRYFGTDGVRGVVGEDLTPQLVERLGRAATLWVGRRCASSSGATRAAPGRELERAFASGVASAGGNAVLAGVLPTPAVALLALDLGVVISASHNPPEYNGVKFFTTDGSKLTDADEEEIEALLDAPPQNRSTARSTTSRSPSTATSSTSSSASAPTSTGLRIGVDCANGAYSWIAPRAFEELGAEVTAIGVEPDGTNINVGCGATDLRALQQLVREERLDLGVAFDGDGDRMLAVDGDGEALDGDQILAVLALDLGVDIVAVTVMTNLGFHRLMAEPASASSRPTSATATCSRRCRREGGLLGGEQSGHIIYLDGHVTGDGLAAALLLCGALRGRTLAEAAAVMERYPQVKENVRVARRELSDAVRHEVERLNAELDGRGRVLVRPSGTEPVIRVLAEAETDGGGRRALC